MAFNFYKGPQKIDEIVSATDADGDTTIDFKDNQIDFIVSGTIIASVMPTQFSCSQTIISPINLSPAGALLSPYLFGDGSDGNVTLDGTGSVSWATRSGAIYTMTRDALCKDLTINSGVILRPNNYLPYAVGTLLNNGTIETRGNNAVGAVPGATYVAAGSWFSAGGNGGSGSINNVGVVGGGSGGNSIGGSGGNGGAGGVNAGGIGNASAVVGSAFTSYRTIGFLHTRRLSSNNNWAAINGSGGGGGGGSNNANGTGGGGGGAAGICAVAANTVINNGIIQSVGGNGANATGTGGSAAAGGGGGGSGGPIFVWTNHLKTTGTIQSLGGTGGTGYNAGITGSAGLANLVIIIKGS